MASGPRSCPLLSSKWDKNPSRRLMSTSREDECTGLMAGSIGHRQNVPVCLHFRAPQRSGTSVCQLCLQLWVGVQIPLAVSHPTKEQGGKTCLWLSTCECTLLVVQLLHYETLQLREWRLESSNFQLGHVQNSSTGSRAASTTSHKGIGCCPTLRANGGPGARGRVSYRRRRPRLCQATYARPHYLCWICITAPLALAFASASAPSSTVAQFLESRARCRLGYGSNSLGPTKLLDVEYMRRIGYNAGRPSFSTRPITNYRITPYACPRS
ncbi:hypothetical protein V8C35DRAFT_214545 [Trichoderma chlorosporum]